MLARITMRHVMIAGIAAFVIYGEYLIWLGSPMAQISAICDDFRALREEVAQRGRQSFGLIEGASAADREPVRLIDKAVRACDRLPEGVEIDGYKAP
jgi:hypothetical protein